MTSPLRPSAASSQHGGRLGFLFWLAMLGVCRQGLAMAPCGIEVVEKGNGWPVPLVELRTTHNVRLLTDKPEGAGSSPAISTTVIGRFARQCAGESAFSWRVAGAPGRRLPSPDCRELPCRDGKAQGPGDAQGAPNVPPPRTPRRRRNSDAWEGSRPQPSGLDSGRSRGGPGYRLQPAR